MSYISKCSEISVGRVYVKVKQFKTFFKVIFKFVCKFISNVLHFYFKITTNLMAIKKVSKNVQYQKYKPTM